MICRLFVNTSISTKKFCGESIKNVYRKVKDHFNTSLEMFFFIQNGGINMERTLSSSEKFDQLKFTDDWMFKAVMSDPQNLDIVKELAERCIQRKIKTIQQVIPEMTKNPEYFSHGVRFDVMFQGEDFYCDIEMQTYKDALPLRSKYYHDVMDMTHFKQNMKYKNMKQTYVIFLLSNDFLSGNLAKYTAETKILENPKLKYDDRRTTIFINPEAYSEDDEIRSLCNFLKSEMITDTLTERISESIVTIKKDALKRREFMSLDEWMNHEKEISLEKGKIQGLAEGNVQGRKERNTEIAKKLILKGMDFEDIKEVTGLSIETIKSLNNQ